MTQAQVKSFVRQAVIIGGVNTAFWYGGIWGETLSGTANVTLSGLLPLLRGVALLCQPWFVPIMAANYFLLPEQSVAAATLAGTSLITLLLYRWKRPARLEVFVRKPQTHIAACVTVSVLALVVVSERLDFPVRRHGQNAFAGTNLSPYKSGSPACRLYCAPRQGAGRWNSNPVLMWQDRVAPDKVEARMQEMQMTRIPTPASLPPHFTQRAPFWWRPRLTPGTRTYQWTQAIAPEGLMRHYATYDPETQLLHVSEE